jgi:hypothetical protein
VGGPDSGMDRFVRAGLVPYLTIRSVVANMRRLAARVVTKKKARPAVVMHWLGRPCGREGNLDDADEFVLEYDLVACRRSLYCVESIGESRPCLPT